MRGVQLDKTALSARLDAQLQLEENLAITLGYSGLIGDTIKDHSARASISLRFWAPPCAHRKARPPHTQGPGLMCPASSDLPSGAGQRTIFPHDTAQRPPR